MPKDSLPMILLDQITPVKMIERSVYSGFYCFEHNLCERYAIILALLLRCVFIELLL